MQVGYLKRKKEVALYHPIDSRFFKRKINRIFAYNVAGEVRKIDWSVIRNPLLLLLSLVLFKIGQLRHRKGNYVAAVVKTGRHPAD
jgi:hypothetical protein